MTKIVTQGPCITHRAPADGSVSAGDVLIGADNATGFAAGGGVGVYMDDAESGELVSILWSGIVELPKGAGTAWDFMSILYWDDGAGVVTDVPGSLPAIGAAMEARVSADTTARVLIG